MSKGILGVALSEARGPLDDLFEKLSGRDGALWLAKLKRMLREGPGEVARVWHTVEIGRHKSAEAMAPALERTGNRTSDWAGDIRWRIPFAQELETLELVKASGRELCGDRKASRAEIFEAGLARGWRLCPAEVGPALRAQYQDQPKGEWLLVAMEPIVGSDGALRLFRVERDGGGRWLRASLGGPGGQWDPEDVWVFVAPSER